MKFLDRFRKQKPAATEREAPVAAPIAVDQRFVVDRARMFDLDRTRRLEGLFRTPRAARDDAWVEAFYDAAWYASIELGDPVHFSGPDGFSYYRLNLPRANVAFDSQSLGNVARDCCERYAGAAIFAGADAAEPEFVFSAGLLDSLLRFDTPHGDPIDRSESAQPHQDGAFRREAGDAGHEVLTVATEQKVLLGSPSADYLPAYTARGLERYMSHIWGIEAPSVCLMVNPAMRPTRNLVIGRKRSSFASDEEIAGEMRRLQWFLPEYRSLIAMPEDWTFDAMVPLASLAG